MICTGTSQPKIAWPRVARAYRQNGGAVLSCNGCVQPRSFSVVSSQLRPPPVGAPPDLQDVVMEPQPASPTSPPSPGTSSSGSAKATAPSDEMPAPDEPKEDPAALKPDRQSASSSSSSAESLFHIDVVELGGPLVAALREDEQAAAPVQSAEVKPDDWATWPEQPPPAVDDSFSSDGGAALTGLTEALEVQTMPKLEDGAAAPTGGSGFDPERIPASVFQPRTSVSQAEWSVASNESLFSIQGARNSADLGGLYGGSRSHFDYFYDEAMAASSSAEPDSKLPTVAEGSEPGDAFESKEFTVPGSARSEASGGSAKAKKAAVFRRHDSGSGGSSSNFSFAFPILAETSPKKRDCVSAALYQPLQKEYEQPPLAPPVSAFMEMTTEEERRRRNGWCCCGCCWFDCSWASCCECCWFDCSWPSCCRWCCRWRWWHCGCCGCSCPSFCRCSWCLCF